MKNSTSTLKITKKAKELKLRIETLLGKKVISVDDLADFSEEDKIILQKIIHDRLQLFEEDSAESVKFHEKVLNALEKSRRYEVYGAFHNGILTAMSENMIKENSMPTIANIGEMTGLSLQTISDHIKEHASHTMYKNRKVKYKMLGEELLTKVYNFAMAGDMSAARLYLEVTNSFEIPPAIPTNCTDVTLG